jgi:hypothetical protein
MEDNLKIRVLGEFRMYRILHNSVIDITSLESGYDFYSEDDIAILTSKMIDLEINGKQGFCGYGDLFWSNPFFKNQYHGFERISGYTKIICSKINKLSYTRNLNRRGENHFI